MSSSSNVQSTEVGGFNQQKIPSSPVNLPEGGHGGLEEDEDEDVDFNPFLKETSSPEASSNLSTENEGLGTDLVDNVGNSSVCKEINLSSEPIDEVQQCISKDSEDDAEEVVMQSQVTLEGACAKESEDIVVEKPKRKKSASVPQPEMGSIYPEGGGPSKETAPIKENTSSSGTDAVEDVNKGELTDSRNSSKLIMDLDDEDAICRRTRAHYSLANFTLDELETFLQETDDDDDLQNVDDEQEYRRFLASVLQDADNDGQPIQENENVDDEDEDEDEENDADFEIEIEEALDSDLDEITRGMEQKEKYGGVGRRPETRQNRRQKATVQNKKKLLGQANRPLRPLLPSVPNAQMASFPALNWQKLIPEGPLHCPSTTQAGLLNGFSPHQLGQLHCLIHEHVQLLVQVFSLCVLDPSRQHIAGEAQRMISEVVHRRDELLSRRKVSYPDFCFRPPYIQPSVSDGLPNFHRVQCHIDSSFASSPQKEGPVTNDTMPSEGRNSECVRGGHLDPLQTPTGSLWMPLISGPILSILDAAPLSLVGKYMTDVAAAVQDYHKRHVDSMFDSHSEREPLFPLSTFPSSAETNSEVFRGAASQAPSTVASSLTGHQPPKKTLAAALVESTKKQSVALAPKEIVKLAQRFYPLFNSALFPHKPPPAAVANRVLFTDAEDELLAMGLMEFNTDWKAIQQRFLPCKSKHQIFVRQKNRCSSKAPENPIKAVRRMKTSPLTAEEKARIHEGLRVLKLDWMSVWKFIVPYRDPSLLPRQWRIALGTQKSYKSDATKREKRRLYESQRRKCKAAALASWQTVPEKEISEDYLVDNAGEGNKSGDGNMDDGDEAYVHEAFLADWRPGNSRFTSSELPLSSLSRRDLQPGGVLPQEGPGVGGTPFGDGYAESQPENGYMHEFLSAPEQSQCLQSVPHFTHVRYSASYTVASNHFDPDWISKSSKGQINLRPYRVRRRNVTRLVRLAPDLPPVNLPPSVRVISQSAFKCYHCGSFHSTKVSCNGTETKDLASRLAQVAKSGTSMSVYSDNSATNLRQQYPRLHMDQHVTEEKGTESDLQMHPLLFQNPEDGRLAYCPINCNPSAVSNFNFLPGHQLQANFHQFGKPQPECSTVEQFDTSLRSKENPLRSCTIDFHPLLQRTDDLNSDSVIVSSVSHVSVDLESFRGNSTQLPNPSDSVMAEPQANSGPPATANSSFEKANELDLEIHLSSTSRDKVTGSGNVAEHNSDGSRIGLLDGSTIKERQKSNNLSQVNSKSCPTAAVAASAIDQGHVLLDHAMILASSNSHRNTECSTCDQYLPEIVMEQEELSDSEEEIGEHVEFECEEMADSEGEESDCEQLISIQNKESTVMVEKEVTNQDCIVQEVVTNGNYNYQRCRPKILCGSKGNVHTTSKGNSRSCKSAMMGKSKHRTGSLQLSLHPSTKGSSTHSKPKHIDRGNKDDRASKILPSRPNRSCKRMMPNETGGAILVHPLDVLQQFHSGTAAAGTTIFSPTRKRRKRVCRNDSAGNLGCSSNDYLAECQPNDTCLRINVRTKADGQSTGGVPQS